MRILVLGAGFGGLELSTRLSEEFGGELDLVLIDQAEGFVFGFSKLDVMFGRAPASAVVHPYRDAVKPGVRFVRTAIRSIEPGAKRVETDEGAFEADVMVVALGADLDPAATPIEMCAKIVDYRENRMLLEDTRSAYKLQWLYSESTAAEDMVVKNVLEHVRDNTTDDAVFTLNVKKFRRLKDGDVAARNSGQRKK